ncbi:alpha/beta hydrolase family protein [Corynebacterium phoceense]|uniref:alpha/beta hydrolase family protein n=1 Tax=Corynebacterium phoceense TaxID=1686286 RepID=UPI00211BB686|nr:alpha/beta hydrolase family protein [Corynebacterium phoceense]MCQ9339903.1 alpha/beta hydrolase family protein [Corynebacterium phoceense]
MSPARSLATAAAQLDSTSSHLHGYTVEWLYHADALFLATAGPAPESARHNVELARASLEQPRAEMAAVAGVLRSYSPLEDLLEPLADGLAPGLAGIGEALDWMCAREIAALCSDITTEPPHLLEDFEGLSLEGIHEIHLSSAPAHVIALAEANPDLLILEASEGRFAALVDPTSARTQPSSITTYIPGTGSSNPASWQSHIDNARALATATGSPAVAWVGYDAPPRVPLAARRAPAEKGARALTRFHRTLRRRFPRTHHIVVGYSYGSTVAGYAARDGMRADDLVFVGSPGAGVHRADELPGRVWSVTNADDPIRYSTGPVGGVHGTDPSTPWFGADPVPGTQGRPGDHSSYWSDPAFFEGVGAIARRY